MIFCLFTVVILVDVKMAFQSYTRLHFLDSPVFIFKPDYLNTNQCFCTLWKSMTVFTKLEVSVRLIREQKIKNHVQETDSTK